MRFDRKAYNKEYSRKRAKERREYLQNYKLEQGCIDCGYNEHPEVLQFDHVRGQKKVRMSQACTWSWENIFAEMKKCEVRCANCHTIVTMKRKRKGLYV